MSRYSEERASSEGARPQEITLDRFSELEKKVGVLEKDAKKLLEKIVLGVLIVFGATILGVATTVIVTYQHEASFMDSTRSEIDKIRSDVMSLENELVANDNSLREGIIGIKIMFDLLHAKNSYLK